MTVPFQVLLGDLRTGKIITQVPATVGTWQVVSTGAGLINATVNVAAQSTTNQDIFHATAPAKAFLAIQYGNTILAAGPIWTRHYTRSAGTLELGAAGLWSLFDHRLVMPVLAQPVAVGAAQAAVTTYPTSSNMSYADIAAALITQAMAHVGGTLPLVLPTAQGFTPGRTHTYDGYDLPVLGSMLTNLTQTINGPEIQFAPRYQADGTSIEWVMRAGTPTSPTLTQGGDDWYFDASVPQTMVADIDYDDDATTMGTRAWTVGAGSKAGIVLSEADSTTLTAAGYPLLEVVDRNHTSDATQADLDAYAAQLLTQSSRPSSVWKITVRNDGAPANNTPITGTGGPRLDEYTAGDYCQVIVGADPFLAPGPRRARILQIDGDINPGIQSTITLATMTAEV